MSTTGETWETFEDVDDETLADIAELELRESESESESEDEWESADPVAAAFADELQEQFEAYDETAETDELFEGEIPPAVGRSAFYVSITSRTQGALRGETTRKGQPARIAGIDFRYGVTSPHDVARGLARGRRQHGAVTMTKAWDAASPQLFGAIARNDVLDSVVFEFMRSGAGGIGVVFQTVKLTNGRLSSFKQVIDRGRQLEEIAFTFERIEISNHPGKTSEQDQWQDGSAAELESP